MPSDRRDAAGELAREQWAALVNPVVEALTQLHSKGQPDFYMMAGVAINSVLAALARQADGETARLVEQWNVARAVRLDRPVIEAEVAMMIQVGDRLLAHVQALRGAGALARGTCPDCGGKGYDQDDETLPTDCRRCGVVAGQADGETPVKDLCDAGFPLGWIDSPGCREEYHALLAHVASLRAAPPTGEEDIRGLLDNYAAHERHCLGCDDDDLEAASGRCEAARNAILAHVAALAARAEKAERVARVESDLARQAVAELGGLRAEVARLTDAFSNVIAHTGLPPFPTKELLLGLLASCERIARAALQGGDPMTGAKQECPSCGYPNGRHSFICAEKEMGANETWVREFLTPPASAPPGETK